jgi:pSer/pThr/pTyr-binding forkhead associated (FHA) protein
MGKGGTRSSIGGRGGSIGRRAGRNTTHQAPAYEDEDGDRGGSRPAVLMDPDGTGVRHDADEADGYHQPTAMFDKGELLGELADLESSEQAPATRHKVEVDEGPKGCRLIIVAGPDLGVEWSFKQPEISIGRAAENDLDFTDIAVSRNHARIVRDGNNFFLEDRSSDNGTFLNGLRIRREMLSSGDEIIIGARTLRFVELNEAPPTAAAHPIVDPPPEPVVGRVSEIAVALGSEKKLGASQVKVGAIPSEPGKGTASKLTTEPKPARGTALRIVGAVVLGLLLLAGLGVGGRFVYKRLTAESEAQKQARARVEFLQGIELVKIRRFADAILLFEGVLAVRPEYMRAKEYKAHCEKEIALWRSIEEARQLVAEHRFDEALDRLERLPEDSAWAPEIQELSKICHRASAEARVDEARSLMEAGELDVALDVVQEALQEFPGLASAIALRDRITGADRPTDDDDKKEKPKPKLKIPPELERAVALYVDDELAAAIDAAEAAGGPNAVRWIDKMKKMQSLLQEATAAHKQKAAAELLKLVPDAMEVDSSIALGEGEIRKRLREYYADALYLKGLEAFQDEDYGRAFQLLNNAIKMQPGHRLSETRISELSRKAKDLYYQGYGLKDTEPSETRRIFRTITQMTRPDNQFHQWASKWLVANGG